MFFFPQSEIHPLHPLTRWWQLKYFLLSPLFGEDSHFDYIIFFKGVETTNQLKFKMVHLKINPGKGDSLSEKIMFRFHVKLSGCNGFFLRGW